MPTDASLSPSPCVCEKRALKSIYGKLYTSRIDPVSFGIMAGHVRGCYQDKYNHKPEKSAGNDTLVGLYWINKGR